MLAVRPQAALGGRLFNLPPRDHEPAVLSLSCSLKPVEGTQLHLPVVKPKDSLSGLDIGQ